jgi:hypothetical protein
MTDPIYMHLLLARSDESVLAKLEENLKANYPYDRLGAKTFLVLGERKPSDTLDRLMIGISTAENICLSPLEPAYAAQVLPQSFPGRDSAK